MKNASLKVISSVALAAAFALSPSAQAVPTMSVSIDGGAFAVVATDQAGGDSSAVPGIVLFTGSIGGWQLIISSGSTKPNNGTATAAEMHLNVSGDSVSATPTTLAVRFSEVNFGPITNGTFQVNRSSTVEVGPGSTGETAAMTGWSDTGNGLFATTTLLGTSTFGPGAFAANSTSPIVNDPDFYSLTTEVVLSHNASIGGNARHSSGQVQIIQNVPEGGLTLTLLGSALLALAAIRRKLFSA